VLLEQVPVDAETAAALLVLERAGEGPYEQQGVVQADSLDQREVGQVGHDHARSAVRMFAADAVFLVEQSLTQRRIEPVRQRGPPLDEPVVGIHPRPPHSIAGAVLIDPGLVLGPPGVVMSCWIWLRRKEAQPVRGAHARLRSAAS
jgi:hypothetical protein